MSEFIQVRYSQISSPGARDLRLADEPAIYSWHRDLASMAPAGSDKDFLTRLDGLLGADLSDRAEGRIGFLYRTVMWESSRPLGTTKRVWLEAVAEDEEARRVLSSILSAASVLQAPLYVGKAKFLRQRIGQHVDGSSGLAERMGRARTPLSQCLLRYRYFPLDELSIMSRPLESLDVDGDRVDAVCLLVEDLITRLTPAAFVRRPG